MIELLVILDCLGAEREKKREKKKKRKRKKKLVVALSSLVHYTRRLP